MIVEKIMNRNNREIEVFVYKALKPRAVLVLAHGASEHVRRYEDFIEFLISNDISIYTYNHLGHGPNRLQDSVYFAAENGHQYLRDDLEDVSIYAYQHNDLPH